MITYSRDLMSLLWFNPLGMVLAIALVWVPCSMHAQPPSLEGYRLGVRRSSLPRDLPCEHLDDFSLCRPSDTLSLTFREDVLSDISFHTVSVRRPCHSPLSAWNTTWRRWATSRFGTPDSVRAASTAKSTYPIVTAFWGGFRSLR